MLFGLLSNIGLAQSYDTTTFQGKVDYVLHGVSKTGISSGILYERVFPYANLHAYFPGSTDTTDSFHFLQALSELKEARYEKNLNFGISEQELNSIKASPNLLSVQGLFYDYQSLDTSKIDDSTIVWQHGIGWGQHKSGNAFTNKSAFIFSPVHGQINPGLPLKVTFNNFNFYTNKNETVNTVEIKIDEHEWVPLPSDDTITLPALAPGNHQVKVRISLSNGAQYISIGGVSTTTDITCDGTHPDLPYFRKPDCSNFWRTTYPPQCEQNIVATTPYLGLQGRGIVSYYYGLGNVPATNNCNGPIRRPIIFVDGIGYADQRQGPAIYGKYLAYPINGNLNEPYLLGREIRENLPSRNYDVIILSFPLWGTDRFNDHDGGPDYIQRNAEVLITLIEQVKAALQANGSQEKIVLVGSSMGGLVTRYALAKMEKNGQDHRVKTWVSFDAPHLGANIPIGVQEFAKFWVTHGNLTAREKGKYAFEKKLNTVAAQQMLLHHHLANSQTPRGAPGFRNEFVQDLESNGLPGSFGWPKLVPRKLALANGAGNGTLNTTEDGKLAIYMKVMLQTRSRPISRRLMGPLFPINDGELEIGNSRIRFSGRNTGSTVFNGYFINPEMVIPQFHGYDRQGYSDASVSLDAAPGGLFDAFAEAISPEPYSPVTTRSNSWLARFFESWFLGIRSKIDVQTYEPNACFIPTKSAIGFGYRTGQMGNLAENLTTRNLACTREIPFDAYYLPNHNEAHVSFSAASMQWILFQLGVTDTQPLVQLNLNSPNGMLKGQSIQATVSTNQAPPQPVRYFWRVENASPGLSISLSGSTTNTATITAHSGSGSFLLSVSAEYVTSTGEVVCYGRMEKLIRVFDFTGKQLPPSPSPTWGTCNGVSAGSSKKMRCYSPSSNHIADGLQFIRYEWQIAQETPNGPGPFGNSCYNGAISISPTNVCYQNQPAIKCANLTFQSDPGTTQPKVYFKAVPVYGYDNSVIEGPHGNVVAITFNYGQSCLPVVEPNPSVLVYAEEQQVELVLSDELYSASLPVSVSLIDQRNVVVFEHTSYSNFPFSISFSGLKPAEYQIVCKDNEGAILNGKLNIAQTAGTKLFISPNPSVQGIDENVKITLIEPPSTEQGYKYELHDSYGALLKSWEDKEQTEMSLSDLSPGLFEVLVSDGEQQWQEQLEFLMKGSPYLTLQPNPAESHIEVTLNSPVYEEMQTFSQSTKIGTVGKGFVYRILHNGHTVIEGSTDQLSFTENVSGLPPGFYILNATDGLKWYTKHFVIIH